jgi:hypothetical protein
LYSLQAGSTTQDDALARHSPAALWGADGTNSRQEGWVVTQDRIDVAASNFFSIAPLVASRVLEIGQGARDLADAYGLINPCATYRIEREVGSLTSGDHGFDLIIFRPLVSDPAELARVVGQLALRLGPGGFALFAAPNGPGPVDAPGLRLLGARRVPLPGDGTGTFLICGAARAADPQVERLTLHFRYMAMRFMDIRTSLPTQQLMRDPHLTVSAQPGAEPFYPARFPDSGPKVLVTQRPGHVVEDDWMRATAKLIRRGWISVIEYDDHPALTSAVYGEAATEEGLRHFSLYHGVQTSTPPLGNFFNSFNPNVAVFPNAVFTLPPFPTRQGPPKVFYGAINRGEWAVRVAASLKETAARFPEVEFIVVGDPAVFEALPTANKRQYGMLPFADYLKAMSWCDVLLSPLEGAEGMGTKSDAKFLDASRSGLVTIASPTVYAETIRHGETGFIAAELGDWDRLLVETLGDDEKRGQIARAAWDYVRSERMFVNQAKARRDWYRSLWDRRDELNAELLERAPAIKGYLTD